ETYVNAPDRFPDALREAEAIGDWDLENQSVLELMLWGFRDLALDFHLWDVADVAGSMSDLPLRSELFALALRLEQFREVHDAYPPSLAELGAPLPELRSYRSGKAVIYV